MKKIILITFFSIFLAVSPVFAATAKAMIKGTAEGSPINGAAIFTEKDGGLEIEVHMANVPPGKHGFHIHEKGSCGNSGSDAGGHYNPDGVMHGMLMKDGLSHAHAGDFGNIEVKDDGTGTLKFFAQNLTLTGEKYNVAGRAVILHEKADDFGQPTGNAGGRIGCGLIEVQK